MPIIFISGIDTEVGKTISTGLLAKFLYEKKESVITQKICQTGCTGISDDIMTHRQIMGLPLTDEDRNLITCPYILKFPASPHLAAKLENASIDIQHIREKTKELSLLYHYVIIEGVGGLAVPLYGNYTLLDYLEEEKYPLLLVSSSKLGSINHTLLSIEVAYKRGIPIIGILYNLFPQSDPIIQKDSSNVFKEFLKKYNYPEIVIDIPQMDPKNPKSVDFDPLF